MPILIVEVLSDSTRRRDRMQKRDLYMDAGVAEYWIVDPGQRAITSVRPGRDDRESRDRLTWTVEGVATSLAVDLEEVFR